MRTRILSSEAMRRCPKMSLLPDHYLEDGTCRCMFKEEIEARLGYLRRVRREALVEIQELERTR